MSSSSQMKMQFNHIMIPEGNEVTNLLELVEQFDRGLIKPPMHQRQPDKWGDRKKQVWIDRLSGQLYDMDLNIRPAPVGVIVTYQLKTGSPIFLNDGHQRLSASREYLKNPTKFGAGHAPEVARQILFACKMPWQHRHYDRHDDALVDFQLLNLGTHLTPFEFYKGILTYMEGYDFWAEAMLNELHKIIADNAQKIVDKTNIRPETDHKYKRHNYALFYRYLTKETSTVNYKVGQKNITNYDEVSQKKSIEWLLRQKFENLGKDEIIRHLNIFRGLIERETLLFCNIWYNSLKHPQDSGITFTCYRWLLDCSIWKRNNNQMNDVWENFVFQLLHHNNGDSQVPDPNNPRVKNGLDLGTLGRLKPVCSAIGSAFYTGKRRKRTKNSPIRSKAGADQSHKTIDSDETFPEVAGRNRSRGRKNVKEFHLPGFQPPLTTSKFRDC